MQSNHPVAQAIKLINGITTPQLTRLLQEGEDTEAVHLRRIAKDVAKKLAEAGIRSSLMQFKGVVESK